VSLKYSNPTTSRQAAIDNMPRAGTQRRRVYEAIHLEGDRGITRDELERSMLDNANSIRPRVKELLEAGLIEETDRTRTTSSGSQAAILVAKTPQDHHEPDAPTGSVTSAPPGAESGSEHPGGPEPRTSNPYEYEVWA